MSRQILLSPLLRASLPRAVRRDLTSQWFPRLKTTNAAPKPPRNDVPYLKTKQTDAVPLRTVNKSSTTHAHNALRKGLGGMPERILIFHAGTTKPLFLGAIRITALCLMVASGLLIVPAYKEGQLPLWLATTLAIGSTIPFFVVTWTSAPFVNFIYLSLPMFARRSRDQTLQYAKNLPPTATLSIITTDATFVPRTTTVRLGDLVPGKSTLRPVDFRDTKRGPALTLKGTPDVFYAPPTTKKGKQTPAYWPGLWDHVYQQIQNNTRRT
ncbi:hypothetical protein P168DRAFT_320628 [Aspergillus campestris IBT 28561]|uniref:Uncharacterized protein n=1 Tax=Aspergillus campestris (strain IBT 28561) TaxID=1392248 RepID=A0A2I1CWS0_ASPC2|nr:uncharacterized protein P168DRAFT_320628 [Aspergillus campestris IBT 28561]PKY02070.1 hypothetical protein P168DRAFT_320628 [Aspergillus campestris IBT 28561]